VGTESTELSESDQPNLIYTNSEVRSRGVTVREDDAVLGVISLLDDFVQEPGGLSRATNEQIRQLSTVCQPGQGENHLEHDGGDPDGMRKGTDTVQHVTGVLQYRKRELKRVGRSYGLSIHSRPCGFHRPSTSSFHPNYVYNPWSAYIK
jgi:hypothetical protein